MVRVQLFKSLTDAFNDIQERFIGVVPTGNGFGIGGKGLEILERGAFPITCSQDDRDDTRIILVVSFHSPLQINTLAVGRSCKICTDEQENNLSGIQVPINLMSPFLAGTNIAIVPVGDESLRLQVAEVFL